MFRPGLFLIGMLVSVGQAAAQDAAPPASPPVSKPTVQPDGADRPPAKPEQQPVPDPVETSTDSTAPETRPEGEHAPPAPSSHDGDAATAPPDAPAMPAEDMPETPASVVPAGPPAWQAFAEDEFAYQSCLLGLTMLGVSYTPLDPITSPEDRDCGIARPLNITAIQPGVTIAGGATLRCDTARRLALWFRNDAAPAARHLPGAPKITEIIPGSTYQCRARVGSGDEKLSEHAFGNAFDVSGLRFSDGSEMLIEPRNDTGDMAEAFQKALRYTACLQFTTVLGPGSNAAHDDHLHFDIAARKGGWRLCE